MTVQQEMFSAPAIRFSVWRGGKEVGHAYLYILTNDMHKEPFGYLEDVFVLESYRGQGIGNELLDAVVSVARARQCYKLVATSRNDGTRKSVQEWYERRGFEQTSAGLRLNLE